MIEADRVEEIFKQMDEYVLELSSDAKDLGAQYFQDKISICRNYLNSVSLVVSELNQEKLSISAEIRKLEALYELEYDNLLATDETVRRLASIEDRKSTIKHMLRKEKQAIDRLKDNLHAVEAVFKVVNHRSKELHATMNEIRDQRRLIQAEIRSGSFYGDERPTRAAHSEEPETGFGVEDINLDALLDDATEAPAETEAETPEATSEPEAVEVPPEPETPEPAEVEEDPEEAAVQRFLERPSDAADKKNTQQTVEDAELADLLNNL